MKDVASKIHRERRGVLKAISASQVTETVLTRENQTVFKNNGKPMVIVDDDTTISLANVEFERLSGYTKKEIEGTKKLTEFVARQDRRRMKEYHLLRKSDPMLAPRCCEFRFVDRQGKIKNTVLTMGQIPGSNKSMASLQDVTDRRGAEITQRADEERYQTFFENSRDAVYITTSDGVYVDANRAALDLFGYTREEMKKVKARLLYADPADARRLQKEIEERGFAQDFEVRLRKKDGTEMDCLFTVTALRGDDGSILEYQGIARDVTERKKEEEILRESEEKYRTILETMHDAYFEVDLAGTFTFVNDAACRHLGYTKEELIGMNNRLYTSPETAKKIYETFNGMYKKGESTKVFDYEAIRKDGTTIMLELSASLVRDAKGKPTGFRGVSREVTERRQMEEVLRQSEERYRTILENIEDGYYETDLAGNYNFVNEIVCKHHNRSREELLSMNFRDHASPENAKRVKAIFSEIYRTGVPAKVVDNEVIRKDGTKKLVELSASLLRNASGEPIGFRGISRDRTEQKQAEEVLRQSEEKYRSILENITEGYFENDLQGNLTFFNESLPEVYGYAKDELLHMNYRQYMDEENAARVYQAYKKIHATGKPNREVQFEIIRKDGTRRYLENSVSLILDAGGKPAGFRGISRDITERRQMEEVLRESEERYRSILESIGDAYTEVDLAGKTTFLNKEAFKFLGYPEEEFVGMTYKDFTTPESAKKHFEIYNRVYRTGEPARLVEFELIAKDGTSKIVESTVELRRDTSGKPIGFRSLTRDITQRRQMEEALRQSEERYRTILETMQEAYYEIDLTGHYTFVNNALCRHLGYAKEELIGIKTRQYQDETDAKKSYKAFNAIYETGKPLQAFEAEYIRKDGTKGTYELSASLIRDSEGKPIGFRGVSRDVSERKQMEEALRQSEERYRTMIETMQDGYWETDLPGNFTYVNDSECKIAGTPREQLLGKNNQQYTDAATAKRLYEIFKGIYTTGEPVKSCEFEFIKIDGTRAFAEFSASLRRDEEGKPIGFQGVTRDVSERKQMEEALKLRLKQLGALSRASQVVAATLAIDDVLQEVVSLANEAVSSDYTGVVLIDESGNLVRSADDVPGIPSIEHRIREKGFTHWINHSHKALIIDEIGEDGAIISPANLDEGVPRFADINLVKAGVKSLAGLPLLAKGRLLGVLYLHGVRPNVFKGQLGLLLTFANQAAIAIENARLFEEAQHELAERKRAEEHLQRYAAELERSNEEVKNFAYIVSHDLRVPLVNLKGYTSELQSALGVIGTQFDAALPHLNDEARSDVAMALHEDVPEALEFITNSVSRMDGFINAVLILSRLGRRELKPEALDMEALVQINLENLSHQIQERGITVTVGSLPEVVADRTSMEQIVGNILGNAVKYLDPDRPGEIEINAERNHQETIFRIRDTGRGIAKDDMHKVFAPFRRAGKQDTPGEGMGLAYVQTLVRRHGGRIWCESEPGKGTTFIFAIANPSGKGAQDD